MKLSFKREHLNELIELINDSNNKVRIELAYQEEFTYYQYDFEDWIVRNISILLSEKEQALFIKNNFSYNQLKYFGKLEEAEELKREVRSLQSQIVNHRKDIAKLQYTNDVIEQKENRIAELCGPIYKGMFSIMGIMDKEYLLDMLSVFIENKDERYCLGELQYYDQKEVKIIKQESFDSFTEWLNECLVRKGAGGYYWPRIFDHFRLVEKKIPDNWDDMDEDDQEKWEIQHQWESDKEKGTYSPASYGIHAQPLGSGSFQDLDGNIIVEPGKRYFLNEYWSLEVYINDNKAVSYKSSYQDCIKYIGDSDGYESLDRDRIKINPMPDEPFELPF